MWFMRKGKEEDEEGRGDIPNKNPAQTHNYIYNPTSNSFEKAPDNDEPDCPYTCVDSTR